MRSLELLHHIQLLSLFRCRLAHHLRGVSFGTRIGIVGSLSDCYHTAESALAQC
jgi:hypothetical protein